MKSKYINPFTDFGFKKIFGEEANKPALIDFLNALLGISPPITNVTFKNSEQLGDSVIDRKAIYDIYCENEAGEKFIVELQKAKQNYFKERTIYYSTYPIREQAEKVEWDFNLKAVYCIGILDFTFDDDKNGKDKNEVVQNIQLRDKSGNVFYEKLTYIYLEMPNFRKKENELSSRLDKWLFFLKHLEDFQNIPEVFSNDVVFADSFQVASLAQLTETEKNGYEYSLKVYRDLKNVIDYAEEDGERKGYQKGITDGKIEGSTEKAFEIASVLKNSGVSIEIIMKSTGLNEQQINTL